ncbi:MAG: nucleotidyltransferase family protein [DPANN group archaeon]|nr:nucleotidyltransferase family protein [DPANN group archaeon]
MKAVILAGGKGKRLRPLTYAIPKPLLPINERPILEHIILYLKKYDITDITISLGYLGYQIKNYFDDGSDLGVNIKYITEDTPLGTAGCLSKIKDTLNETFILMGGDNITNLDLNKFIEYHNEKKGVGTVALFEFEQPVEWGVYNLDNTGKVEKFLEKPRFKYLGGTMIFCLEPEIFDFFPDTFEGPLNLTDHIIPKILEANKGFYGYPFNDYWLDIGRIEDYDKANKK